MSALGACPICREVLEPDIGAHRAPRCPACGADLAPFIELESRVAQYAALCRDLLSRGEHEQAGGIIEQLAAITSVDPSLLAELNTRRLLAAGQPEAAQQALLECNLQVRSALHDEIVLQLQLQQSALELYNHALTAARSGAYRLAAEQMQRACALAPHLPELWRLKLKADIKCGYFARCYADLQSLDGLGGRPAQYAGLEQLLPPLG